MQEFLKEEDNKAYTEDSLLNGKVIVRQPEKGYRFSIDSVLLAAAVSMDNGENILDVGAGVGVAGLCLAYRFEHLRVVGIECQRNLVRLATDNILLNSFRDRVEILYGDLQNPPPRLAAGSYSQVISNPPYFDISQGRASPYYSKAISNHTGSSTMEIWIKFCLLMLKPLGKITFIYRADMLDYLLSLFYGKVGQINVLPLWSSKNQPAKRVIIQGTKGMKGGLNLLKGISMHNQDGSFSDEANAILRDGQPISFCNGGLHGLY